MCSYRGVAFYPWISVRSFVKWKLEQCPCKRVIVRNRRVDIHELFCTCQTLSKHWIDDNFYWLQLTWHYFYSGFFQFTCITSYLHNISAGQILCNHFLGKELDSEMICPGPQKRWAASGRARCHLGSESCQRQLPSCLPSRTGESQKQIKTQKNENLALDTPNM